MYLLSTSRAELQFFSDPGAVPGGYAILSHTWQGEEQSYQEVEDIRRKCGKDRNPRDYVSQKIRDFCVVAERDGYDWAWADMCCINKESSTELSEAINSMFNWYLLAEVCYAYLEDVHKDDNPHGKDSEFRRARWHKRGWTLQELLAPALVVFMSKEWVAIGTKHDLFRPISKCTGIHKSLLTREKSFLKASIAERMSWAAHRKTSRVEDEAYCLLGLFNITMPTIYGEGHQAFQRLQQEIAKHYFDTTLFAWGRRHGAEEDGCPAVSLQMMWSSFHSPMNYGRFLFAVSPLDFYAPGGQYTPQYTPELPSKDVLQPYMELQRDAHNSSKYSTRQRTGPFDRIELPSFEETSHGMKCRFPVAEVDGITIAVLLVETAKQHLGLILHPASGTEIQDPCRKTYYTMWSFQKDRSFRSCRVACLGGDLYNLRFRGKPVNAKWSDIYIHAGPRISDERAGDPAHLVLHFAPDCAPTPFRIPRWLVRSMSALSFTSKAQIVRETSDLTGSMDMWVEFTDLTKSEKIRLKLGVCVTRPTTDDSPPCRYHWAWAEHKTISTWSDPWGREKHDCSRDHIDDWPVRSGKSGRDERWKEFGDKERTITLSFAPCVHAPQWTRALRIALSGSFYEKVQRGANFFLPHGHAPGTTAAASRAEPALHSTARPLDFSRVLSTESLFGSDDRPAYPLGPIVLSSVVAATFTFILCRATLSAAGAHPR